MAVQRREQRTRSLLVALVLVAITLVTIDSRERGAGVITRARQIVHDGLAPVQRTTHDALAPVGNLLTGAFDYGSLRAENGRLRREVAALEAGGTAAAAATAEAQAIIAGAHLPFVGSVPTVQVLVIDSGSSNFDNALTVDKGSDDGIVVGQPVVAAGLAGVAGSTGGLVGSVGTVGPHTATINLLTQPGEVVGVSLPSGNTGTAEGVGPGEPLQVSVISTADPSGTPKLTRGEQVATSGLPLEQFPSGIPVGTVASVSYSQASSEPTFTLDPFVDLSRLSVLEVELWSPQSAAP